MFVGRTGLGRAAGGGFAEKIGAQAFQTGGISETREGESEGLRTGRATQGHFTVFGDSHGGGARRHGLKTAQYGQAVAGDDLAGGIYFKGSVAGVSEGAVGALDFEEAVALDREVELFAGGSELALRENFRGSDDAGTVTDFDAGG